MRTILIITFLFLANVVSGQIIAPDNRIIVLGEASIEMPADQVTFSIRLVSTDSLSLDHVYDKHQKLEANIHNLLNELKIPSKNISFSLLSVSKEYNYETKEEYFMASQHVTFTLDSVKLVPKIQTQLIRGGFSQFGSSFTSTEMEKHKKELLEKAVFVAKEKATALANAADRKIKRIVKISDTDESDYMFHNYTGDNYAVGAAGGGNLTEIPQTVSISTTIKVIFELK